MTQTDDSTVNSARSGLQHAKLPFNNMITPVVPMNIFSECERSDACSSIESGEILINTMSDLEIFSCIQIFRYSLENTFLTKGWFYFDHPAT